MTLLVFSRRFEVHDAGLRVELKKLRDAPQQRLRRFTWPVQRIERRFRRLHCAQRQLPVLPDALQAIA